MKPYVLNLIFTISLQLIFRKVADVKREKELAEKRKNDPPLDLAADHPVRKLISRFRKISDSKLHVADLEKGSTRLDLDRPHPPANGKAHIINIDENQPSHQNSSMSRWGRFLAGAAGAAPPASGPPSGGNPAHPRPVKPMSKFSKLLASKQDTIEEKPEEEEKVKSGSRGRIDFSDSNHDNISHQSDGAVTQRDVVFSVGSHNGGPISAAEQQLINSLYDIKLEIKEEIDVLNQKMNKIDYQINEILKLFSPSSSPYSSHTPSFSSRGAGGNSSVGSSTSSTASNSMVTSPKSSVPSSPHRHALENMPATSIDSSRTGTPPSRKGSAGSGSSIGNGSGSQGSGGGSRKSSPVEQVTSDSSSSRKTSKKSRKSSPGSRSKVAPFNDDTATQVVGGITPAKDDDSVPVKDRDLDIL